jgi:Ran GTPase-activating protein (RanGAP) involved in mRNA processing and transport
MVLKGKTIYSFYQRIDNVADVHETPEQNGTDSETDEAARWLAEQLEEEENERIAEEIPRQSPSKVQRINSEDVSVLVVERNPGVRQQI